MAGASPVASMAAALRSRKAWTRAVSKPLSTFWRQLGARQAGGGLDGGLGGEHDGLRGPGEAIDFAGAAGAGAELLGVVPVEGVVDAAEDGFEGDAGVAPGFDERPVEGGEHEERAASAAGSAARSR